MMEIWTTYITRIDYKYETKIINKVWCDFASYKMELERSIKLELIITTISSMLC